MKTVNVRFALITSRMEHFPRKSLPLHSRAVNYKTCLNDSVKRKKRKKHAITFHKVFHKAKSYIVYLSLPNHFNEIKFVGIPYFRCAINSLFILISEKRNISAENSTLTDGKKIYLIKTNAWNMVDPEI